MVVHPVPLSALDQQRGGVDAGVVPQTTPGLPQSWQHRGGQPVDCAPSGEALSVLTLLLDACLSTHHMPTLEDKAKEVQQEGKAGELVGSRQHQAIDPSLPKKIWRCPEGTPKPCTNAQQTCLHSSHTAIHCTRCLIVNLQRKMLANIGRGDTVACLFMQEVKGRQT